MSPPVRHQVSGTRAVSLTFWDLVEIRPLVDGERGLFARRDIARSAVIGSFDGRAVLFPIGPDGRLATAPYDFKDLIQLRRVGAAVLALAPVDSFEGIDFVNHSCRPNARLRHGVVMVALRRIREGEQITMDYRKMDIIPEGIECWCDTATKCRI